GRTPGAAAGADAPAGRRAPGGAHPRGPGAGSGAPRGGAGRQPDRPHPTEFALLEYLMRRPGDVLTRATLVAHVWDFAFGGHPRIVNVYVRSLRDKIDRPFNRASLETVWGLGYRIRDDALGRAAD